MGFELFVSFLWFVSADLFSFSSHVSFGFIFCFVLAIGDDDTKRGIPSMYDHDTRLGGWAGGGLEFWSSGVLELYIPWLRTRREETSRQRGVGRVILSWSLGRSTAHSLLLSRSFLARRADHGEGGRGQGRRPRESAHAVFTRFKQHSAGWFSCASRGTYLEAGASQPFLSIRVYSMYYYPT